MGGTFAKAFLMYLLVFGIGVGVIFGIGIVTAPLDIPLMGIFLLNFLAES